MRVAADSAAAPAEAGRNPVSPDSGPAGFAHGRASEGTAMPVTVVVTISNGPNYLISAPGTATVNILDND